MITASLPAALTFVFQRVERLLSSRGTDPEATVAVPPELTGTLQLPLQPDEARLQACRDQLETLRDALADYAHGDVPVTATPGLLRTWARLRDALEDIYGQRLTFDGEHRPASGPFVHQKADHLTGKATGMEADDIRGNARVVQDMGTVGPDAEMTGMKGKRIGPA
ncbi:hypothetical protein OG399_45340 [Streptomyces achromogenes]